MRNNQAPTEEASGSSRNEGESNRGAGAASSNNLNNSNNDSRNMLFPVLRHLEKQGQDINSLLPRWLWNAQLNTINTAQHFEEQTPPLRSDAFVDHGRELSDEIGVYQALDRVIPVVTHAPEGPQSETKRDDHIDAVCEEMAFNTLSANSNHSHASNNIDGDSYGLCDSDSSSDSIDSDMYGIPDDTLDELQMQPYEGDSVQEPSLSSFGLAKQPSVEANLQLELSYRDQELSKLKDMVDALHAEMLVQKAELEGSDRKASQLEATLQCSICLEPFSQPHSLGCGHTFCMTCLKQWLAQSMHCPTCRAPVNQRPSVAFVIQDVLRCLNIGSESNTSSTTATQRRANQDPWAHLSFTQQQSSSANGNYERCRACSRWTLRGGTCPHCDLERIRRRLANSMNVESSTPRQPPAIQISRLTRRPSQVISRVERLLESARTVANAYNRTVSHQPERNAAEPPPNMQSGSDMLVLRRADFEMTRSQSPPESLFDPVDLLQDGRSSWQQPQPPLNTSSHRSRQPPRSYDGRSYLTTGPSSVDRELRELDRYQNQLTEPSPSPTFAEFSDHIQLSDSNRHLAHRSFTAADHSNRGENARLAPGISTYPYLSDTFPFQQHQTYRQYHTQGRNISPNYTQPRNERPNDYYVLRLDDSDSTTDEGDHSSPLNWYRSVETRAARRG
ncbi:hypothetical protein BX070DRAFT_250450 [Coemansia spiralis]|nr:hypothetical protein BX070DRAFT_250450 [Coemansia spiralis]